MNIKNILSSLWKLPLCGLAFFVGMALSGVLLPLLGFTPPEMPAGTDAGTITLWFLLGSMLLAAILAPLSRHAQAGGLARWLMLSLFVWVFAAEGMVLESFFYGGAEIGLSVYLFNQRAIKVYERAGFVKFMERIVLVNGRTYPAQRMKKPIE